MISPATLSSVTARVGEIRARIATMTGAAASDSTSSATSDAALAAPAQASGFDPFGQAYQQALLATGTNAGGDESPTSALTNTIAGTGDSGVVLARPQQLLESLYNSTGVAGLTGTNNLSGNGNLTGGSAFSSSASGVGTTGSSNGVVAAAAPTDAMIAGSISGTLAARNTGVAGGYGDIAVPTELADYGNGNIPDGVLEPVGQGGHKLWAPAAESWKQAVAAAKADGVDLRITDSYRSYDEQVDLAGRKGLFANGGLAAVPGTSDHGWGMAVDADVTTPAARQWLVQNGHRFGWVQQSSREPWHWEYRPAQA